MSDEWRMNEADEGRIACIKCIKTMSCAQRNKPETEGKQVTPHVSERERARMMGRENEYDAKPRHATPRKHPKIKSTLPKATTTIPTT